MPRDLAEQLLPRVANLWNMYGPTETTVWSATYRVTAVANQIPVGRPIANTQIYILDQHMQPTPVSVPGELYIGGRGVSRGYLNRPQLTAERFVSDPFNPDPDARLYKTGDAARYLPDGNVAFIGRLDFQVKVRGFRIELGEIEAVLDQHAAVEQSVVIVHEDSDGDKRLVAYYIPASDHLPAVSNLRSHIQESLPAYMIPSVFMAMAAFPLTPNRKVNRKALPQPEQSRPQLEVTYVPPQTEVEKEIAETWRNLLKVEKIGVQDNFFDLGGHSLLVTRLLARTSETFEVDVPLRTFFETPTIAFLAEQIEIARWLREKPPTDLEVESEEREEFEL